MKTHMNPLLICSAMAITGVTIPERASAQQLPSASTVSGVELKAALQLANISVSGAAGQKSEAKADLTWLPAMFNASYSATKDALTGLLTIGSVLAENGATVKDTKLDVKAEANNITVAPGGAMHAGSVVAR